MTFRFVLLLVLLLFTASGVTCTTTRAYQFELGEWNATIFKDGALSALPSLFSVPESVVRNYFRFFYPDENFGGSLNVLLLQKDGQTMLVDAGLGPSAEGGMLIQEMGKMGVMPGDVTDVLLTHAHLDHTGGLLTADGGRAFPNATVHVSVTENLFWLQSLETIQQIAPQLPPFLSNGTVQVYSSVVAAYNGSMNFLNAMEEPFPGITLKQFSGHTPGHLVVDISSGGKTLSYIGDTFFTRTTHVQNPEWFISADTFPEQAIADRMVIMGDIADNDKMTILYHDDFPGLGYIQRDRAVFEFAPIARIV